MATMTAPVQVEKLEKFVETDFKRWHQKMMFYLTTLNLVRVLNEDPLVLKEGENDKQIIAVMEAWKHSDFLCKNYILSELENTLYNVYSSISTAKELWASLDKKYKIEDADHKKFMDGKFLDYKIVD